MFQNFTSCIFDLSGTFVFQQVKDDDRALSLGTLTIPLMRLLGSPELTMDQWFQLENSGSASRIYVKIVLRVSLSVEPSLYTQEFKLHSG